MFDSEPWSFDRHLVAIQRFERNTNIRELAFNRVSFWVLVYNIPIRFMNHMVAEGIYSRIGMVCNTENSIGEGGDFMGVKSIN